MNKWLKLYHHSPYPLRVLVASARGYYLRSWRYGPETDQIVEEALAGDYWSPQNWKSWQEERLAYILHRSATRVPFYSNQWSARRRRGDKASWEHLENWPILKKESVREKPHAFVADDCDIQRMFPDHTSGTTGKPLTIWLSRETLKRWYGLNEARVKMWSGLSRYDRWAIFGGQLVVPYKQTTPPFWVWNAGLNQLYMSSYHLAPEFVQAYLEAMKRYEVKYILGYPSSMHTVAHVALEKRLEKIMIPVAIGNAEPLYEHQRETIAEAFQCQVRNTYGMAEIVCAASECDEGNMHLWPEVGIVEILKDHQDEPEKQGQAGRIICTGLLNPDMSLIRYEVGDRGVLGQPNATCLCGRTLPVLQSVEGRQDDIIITRDGRRVGRLDPIFKADLPIREAQIIQESLDRVRILIICTPEYSQRDGDSIVLRLQERIGDVDVILEQVDTIPRTQNGKFKAVISNIRNL